MTQTQSEFQEDCQNFTALTALKAAEGMPLSSRVMIYRGIIALLPPGSAARTTAENASAAMEQADRNQLHLFKLLDHADSNQ